MPAWAMPEYVLLTGSPYLTKFLIWSVAIDFIKPLVVNKKVSLSDAAKRWEAQNLPQEKKVSDVIWDEVLIAFEKTKAGRRYKNGKERSRRYARVRIVMK